MPFVFNPFTNNLDITGTNTIPPGELNTLTGNTGGAVSASGGGNINVVGDGTTTTIVGNPGTNTLTVSSLITQGIVTVTGNTGGPVSGDVSHNLNIVGSGIISLSGSPFTNTLTITGTVPTPFSWKAINSSQLIPANTGYMVDCGVTTISLTLPSTGVLGDTLTILKVNATGVMEISLQAGQTLVLGNLQSTGPTGTVSSTELGSSLTLVYYSSNTWMTHDSMGNFILT